MNKVWMCSGSTYTQVGSGYKVSELKPVFSIMFLFSEIEH